MNNDPLKDQSDSTLPLPYLPEETWAYILSLLDPQALVRFASVSKSALRLATDKQLWKSFLQEQLPSLNLENEKEPDYKELVKIKIIYLDKIKANFIKAHQQSIQLPPLYKPEKPPLGFFDTILGKKTPLETFEELAANGNKQQLEHFLPFLSKVMEKKYPTGAFIPVLRCALDNDPGIFQIVCKFIFKNFSLKTFSTDANLWLLAKFLEHQIPVETFLIEGRHPIFYAINEEQWLAVEFFSLFHPSCLSLVGNLNWRSSRKKTVIEFIFEKNLSLGISLIPFCFFLDKKLLSSEALQLLAVNLTEEHLPSLKQFIAFINFKVFKHDEYISILHYFLDIHRHKIDTDKYINNMFGALASLCRNIINDVDTEKNTALHKAANLELLHGCALLLKNGADPNQANTKGETTLHLLAKHRYDAEIIDLLNKFFSILINKHHADLTRKNNAGKTPIQIALDNHNTLLLKILILECHASKFITEEDIEVSYKNIDVQDQILVNEKNALLLILQQQKKAEKRQLEYNIAAAGGIIKPKEKNIQLDELDPDTSFMGITKR